MEHRGAVQSNATAVPMDRLVAMAQGRDLPELASGAAVFADICGFSALATRLERATGPELATERLSAAVDGVFGVLIDALHRSGGAAVGFAGDAVTGWIEDRPGARAAPRAAACALAMQRGVAELASDLRLALRVGIADGPARRLLLGDPAVQRLDAVAGATVSRAVAAQDRARPGEVIAARDGGFVRIHDAKNDDATVVWPDPAALALPPGVTDRWQHPAVLEHLESGAPLLADLRRVAVLFARCPPLDFDADDSAGERLDGLARRAQRALADAGGTLLHVVVGDKGSYLVGAVGAPVAQPDHSRRLACAALALHAATPERVAIGLAEGRAWAGLVGTPERSCYTLLGGVMNRAARLMEHARAGETYVSPRLARPLAGAFELRDAGRVTVKGEAEPVALTAVVGARAEDARGATTPPIVGRATELDRLRAALADAVGGARRWASIRAAPGLGKSRLLHALVADAGDEVAVVRVIGSAADRATPYVAWRDAFAALAGDALGRALAALPAPARDHAPLLRPVLPGAPPETDATRGLSTDARQESTQRLLTELLDVHRAGRPLLVCADDTQWLDSGSAALLRRVARDLDRVLVVAAARPEARREEEPAADVLLDLAPLADDETQALVAQALGVDAVPDAVGRFIAERAGGHPLFTEQLAFALRDADCLAPDADLGAVEVPESVEGLIANRLDGLPAHVRTVAKVASVVGDAVSRELLLELGVAGVETEIGVALERLAAAELTTAGPRYAFRHALIRDVVYGRLLHGQRRELHRAVAVHHEKHRPNAHAVLAEHWERAGEPARAVDHLEVAGPAALQAGAFAECVALLERAFELDPAAAPRRCAGWGWHAAQAYYRLGQLEQSRARAEAAVASFDRPVPAGGARLAAGLMGQTARQLALRTPARRWLARASGIDRERVLRAVRAYLNLAELYYVASRKPQSAYAVLRQLNLAEAVGPSPELVEAYGAMCIICGVVGRRRMAERYEALAFGVTAQVQDPSANAVIRHQASLFRSGIGDFARALAGEDEALAIYRRTGDLGRTRDCLGVAGVAAHQAGRTEAAERYFGELLATRRGDERFLQEVWAHTWLGAGVLRAGDVDGALAHLGRANARREGPGHEAFGIVIDALLALAYWHAGRRADSAAAAGRARAAIAATRARPSGHLVLDGYDALAELARAQRDADALARSCRDLAAFTRVFPTGAPARWRHVGELAAHRGRHDEARAAWQRSRSAAARLDMRHDLALAERRLEGRVAEAIA